MIVIRKIFVFITLFLSFHYLHGQNMHGTWRGIMDNEMLIVSIDQRGMQICGFTHDYILRDSTDHCVAAYSGKYLPNSKTWLLTGTRMIKNSGNHVLMQLLLWEDELYGKNRLRGKVSTDTSAEGLMSLGSMDVLLRKISNDPIKLPGGEPNCFPKPQKKLLPPTAAKPSKVNPKPAAPKPTPVKTTPKPAAPKPAVPKPAPIVRDTVKRTVQQTIKPAIKTDADLLRKMTERKQSKQSTLEVNVKQINLKVYDNGEIDNDTVSIFYNGKLLLSHQRLSDKPIIINLDLDENIIEHTLTMYAENLGSIPPNTALIVVTAGDKRYELRSKANLEENAVLIFEYKPK